LVFTSLLSNAILVFVARFLLLLSN
jgi:hypothetical protein